MRWRILLFLAIVFLAIVPEANGDTAYYYCSSTSMYHATVYFSQVFPVVTGIDRKKIESEFLYYLTVYYKESLQGKVSCSASSDSRKAGVAEGQAELKVQNMQWRMVATSWRF